MSAEASPLPPILAPRFDAIPPELRALSRWVIWTAAPKAGGKISKIPHNARSGVTCNAHDEAHWSTFDQARAGYRRFNAAGVGFDLNEDLGIVGIDLDDALDERGQVRPWAQAIVDELDSYTERSPSGRGLRIFCWGGLTVDGRNNGNGVEMYCAGRYLTCTGHHLEGTPLVVEARDFEARDLFARLFDDEQEDADAAVGELDDDGPPVHQDQIGMEFWTGTRFVTKPDGQIDRSRTLYAIACHLQRAGATLRATVAALKERDDVLGYLKYRSRPDLPLRDAMRASRAVQREKEHTANTVAPGDPCSNCPKKDRTIAQQATEIARLVQERHTLLAVQRNPKIKTERDTVLAAVWEVSSAQQHGRGDAEGWVKTTVQGIDHDGTPYGLAPKVGKSPARVIDHLGTAEKWGLLQKEARSELVKRTDPATGEITEKWQKATYLRLLDEPSAILEKLKDLDPITIEPERQSWGGDRPRCPKHPDAATVDDVALFERHTVRCGVCRTVLKQTVNPIDRPLRNDQDGRSGTAAVAADLTALYQRADADVRNVQDGGSAATPATESRNDQDGRSVGSVYHLKNVANGGSVIGDDDARPADEAPEPDAPADPPVAPIVDPLDVRLRAELAAIARSREGPPPLFDWTPTEAAS
ncbi:MAG: hypothetical protein ACR2QA_02995 [Solirubrobacteraceae bacterium]